MLVATGRSDNVVDGRGDSHGGSSVLKKAKAIECDAFVELGCQCLFTWLCCGWTELNGIVDESSVTID